MPEDAGEEPPESDEELNQLKAELEKERAKHAIKKPAVPEPKQATEAVKPPASSQELTGDDDLNALKAELQRERAKYSIQKDMPPKATVPQPPSPPTPPKPTPPPIPQQPAPAQQPSPQQPPYAPPQQQRPPQPAYSPPAQRPTQQPPQAPAQQQRPQSQQPKPSQTKTLDDLEAELEEEEKKKTPQKPPAAVPLKPTAPTPPAIPQQAPEPAKQTLKPTITISKQPAKPAPKPDEELKPKPREKLTRPTLEPLEQLQEPDELLPDTPPAKKQKASKTSPLILIVLLLVVAAAAIGGYLITQQQHTITRYQCWDNTWVEDQTLCPTPTTLPAPTTTEAPPTTTIFSKTTTTTIQPTGPIVCYNNSMCEKPAPYMPYCEDRYVKTPAVKNLCYHPGLEDSYCQTIAATPSLVKTCDAGQYCYGGECYPSFCRDHTRNIDKGEEKVDCGGPCKPCSLAEPICNKESDCGKDQCSDPYCNSARNPTQNCIRNVCENPGTEDAKCTQKNTIEVIEICGQWKKCVDGHAACYEGRGDANCHNCIQDQGEEGTDCGGPCKPCATRPPNYDTLNLTATQTIGYQGYQLKLNALLREINCSAGADIQAIDPYGFTKNIKITQYNSTEFYDIRVGMLDATANSIRVWIVKKVPI